MSSQLPNYLRAHRKGLGLSQKDLAFLLGASAGEQVCRFERFCREPNLAAAFACEVVFGKAASTIFNGMFKRIENEVAGRAKKLAARQAGRKLRGKAKGQLQVLESIAGKSIRK